MKLNLFFIILLLLMLFLESALLSFPFIFFWSAIFFLMRKKIWVILFSVFVATALDYLRLSVIGITSFSLLILFLFIIIQKQFFEAADYKVILAILMVCSLVYSIVAAYGITLAFLLACIINPLLAFSFLKSYMNRSQNR